MGRTRKSVVLGCLMAVIVLVPIGVGLTLVSSGSSAAGTNAGFSPVGSTATVSAAHVHASTGADRADVPAPATHASAGADRADVPAPATHASAGGDRAEVPAPAPPATRRTGWPGSTKTKAHAHRPAVPSDPVALLATVRRPTTIRVAPGGAPIQRLPLDTPFGSPQVLWVVKQAPGWLGVISPVAGNGHVGWIPRADTSLSHTEWELQVSLSLHRLTVIDGGRVLRRYTIAIGAPGSPTPTGRFAVTDRLTTRDPSGPYGCCVVALSALAPHAIQGWDGGDRIAIHSTPGDPGLGKDITHGCMHLTMADARWLLYHVPLGTPTLISA